MKSLKEEIKEKLTYFPINQTGDYERISNEILKLIEKRIDEIQRLGDGNYFGYSGDTEFIDGFDIGFVTAFSLIKKEMLE